MSKQFEKIKRGLLEAIAHAEERPTPGMKIHYPKPVDVKALRMEIGMTQEQFAAKFGVSTAAPKGRLIPPSPATATHATRARYTRWAALFL